MPKYALANGLWIGEVDKLLPKLTTVEQSLISKYRCRAILIKLRYIKGGNGQYALKGNLVSFPQDPITANKLITMIPPSLDSLSESIAIHFVGATHPPIDIIKACDLLYVRRAVVSTWITWLQIHHVGYKDITIDTQAINTLPHNDIPSSILRSIFESTNIGLANAEHRTKLHKRSI